MCHRRTWVWITSRALEYGIIQEVLVGENCDGSMTNVYSGDEYHCGDWFRTYEAAEAYAKNARDERICTLERQIDDLRAIVFKATIGGGHP